MYLRNAGSAIVQKRNHASLLFWCAGNELYPAGKAPNARVQKGLEKLMGELYSIEPFSDSPYVKDNGLLVLSSMSNYTDFDPSF